MSRHTHIPVISICFIAAIGICSCLIVISCLSVFSVHGQTSEQPKELYESIQVEPGDSLWSISSKYYSPEYKSLEKYMKRIMKLNHMTNSDIRSGTYLVIPYYDL